MFFPYRRQITIEDLYYLFTYYESSDLPEERAYFRKLQKYSWRVVPHSYLLLDKLTFSNLADNFLTSRKA